MKKHGILNLLVLVLLVSSKTQGTSMVHERNGRISSSMRIYDEDFLPLDSNCTRGGPFDYPKCEPGLWCIGKTRPLCKKRSKLGEECGSEYKECEGLALCNRSNICVRNPSFDFNYLKLNDKCGDDIVKHCLPGLWCIAKKCRRLVRCGDACGLETQQCRPGLECRTIHATRKRICSRILDRSETVLQKGDECDRGRGRRCRTGLVCSKLLYEDDEWNCRVPKRLGMKCAPGLGQCESGRRCVARRFTGVTRCVQAQRVGERCGGLHVICYEKGSFCGFARKRCVRLKVR